MIGSSGYQKSPAVNLSYTLLGHMLLLQKSHERLISAAKLRNYLDRLGAKRVAFHGSRNSLMVVRQIQLNFLRFSCIVRERTGSPKETGSMSVNQGEDMSNNAGKIVPQVSIIHPKMLTMWTASTHFQGNIFGYRISSNKRPRSNKRPPPNKRPPSRIK